MDAPLHWHLGFQASGTPIMRGIINFHNHIMFFVVGIAIFVFWLMFSCLYKFNEKNLQKTVDNFTHATTIEIVWTVVPAIILIFIAIPSFSLLYSMDEMLDPAVTLKVIGHQWYWTYEYSDYAYLLNKKNLNGITFDSYMLNLDSEMEYTYNLRLLDVDNRVILPIKTHIRVLITSADVLHSWAVPSFGIKVDACPGRLNQTMLYIQRAGVFFGQCSELCGTNHGFMPIGVQSLSVEDYIKWVNYIHVVKVVSIIFVVKKIEIWAN